VGVPACLSSDMDAFILKYPFTNEAKRRVDRAGIRLDDLAKPENKDLVIKAMDFLEDLVNRGEKARTPLFGDSINVVLIHFLAMAMAAHLNSRLWRRIADAESKLFSRNLAKEDPACIAYVAREFGMRIEPSGRVAGGQIARLFESSVNVWDYLKAMPRNDPYWSLGSRPLIRGYVLVNRLDLVRLVEESVEKQVINLISSFNKEKELFARIIEPVKDRLGNLQERVNIKYEPVNVKVTTRYPPCIESIMKEMRSGGNPSHMARFAYAAFMINALTDYDGLEIEDAVERIINDFKTVADFSEKITRYQVEHISGLKGGRNKYLPPSCQEMNTLGLCPTNLGCGTRNPLQYYAKSRLSLPGNSKERKQGN
jgi:DNA primase large subunit